MATFEAAKELLQQGNQEGNVFEHITGVVLKILQERPNDALSSFESLSLCVKERVPGRVQGTPTLSTAIKDAQRKWSADSLRLVSTTDDSESEGVQNLYEDSLLLQCAGVNLSVEELFILQRTMQDILKQQAETEDPVTKIRFWGKLLGCRGLDYSVFECECGSEVEIPENMSPGMEGREGANKYTYFVYSNGVITKLPHVSEQQIVIARQTHKFLTGDLSVDVSGYPPFPGKEANYVRALIALISSDTKIAPRGFFEKDEETEEVVPRFQSEEDRPNPLTTDEVSDLSAWNHFEMNINSMGRMTPAPEVENSEGEMEPDRRYEEAENMDGRDVLGALQDDNKIWKVGMYPASNVGNDSFSVVKSLRWPGGVAVTPVGKLRFVNCYVGYGIPALGKNYTPPALPPLQVEYNETFSEQADVTAAPVLPEGENPEEEE